MWNFLTHLLIIWELSRDAHLPKRRKSLKVEFPRKLVRVKNHWKSSTICAIQILSLICCGQKSEFNLWSRIENLFFRKFNNSVATCHTDATVKTISWLKDGKELVDQCEDCSELELFIQLFPDDFAFYECHVNETTGNGEETKLTDLERFPGNENYTISWFECCGGVSYIYLHLDPVSSTPI